MIGCATAWRRTDDDRGSGAMTFIVRLSKDDRGRITGIVERVATGEKERFQDR